MKHDDYEGLGCGIMLIVCTLCLFAIIVAATVVYSMDVLKGKSYGQYGFYGVLVLR